MIFGPFRLDIGNQCLWRGTQELALTPKSFAVLRYLLENPARLVSKDELLEAVWHRHYVSDAVLRVCIKEIRKALEDDPKTPRYIETRHRLGYRFIGKVPVVSAQAACRRCCRSWEARNAARGRCVWLDGRRRWRTCKTVWMRRSAASARCCSSRERRG